MNKAEEEYNSVNSLLLQLYDEAEMITEEKKVLLYNEYLKKIRQLAYSGNAKAQFDLAGHYEDMGFWGINNPFYNPKKTALLVHQGM